jgi:hypothetical protein
MSRYPVQGTIPDIYEYASETGKTSIPGPHWPVVPYKNKLTRVTEKTDITFY